MRQPHLTCLACPLLFMATNCQSAAAEAQRATLAHAQGIIVSYAGLVLQMPDMFPQPQKYGLTRVAGESVDNATPDRTSGCGGETTWSL